MKRLCWFSMLLVLLLTACSPGSSGYECKDGICISIHVEGPVQAMEPARFILNVRTEKDVSNLGLSIYGYHDISILDIEKQPDVAEMTYRDERSMDWWIDTIGGTEYFITGHVVFPKPTVSYGISSWGLFVAATRKTGFRVTDSVTIYLDAEGKQVDESKAETDLEDGFPIAPTAPPDLTIVPETPVPTVAWPTETPSPTPTFTPSPSPSPTRTPTLPAYP